MGYLQELYAALDGNRAGVLLWDEYMAWARKMLQQPADYGGPLYKDGYAPVYSWASRGDDNLERSNYFAFAAELEGVDAWLEEDPEYVLPEWETWYLGEARHWLVGVLQQVVVRVLDDDEQPTPHGIRAFQLWVEMEDYPILDEDSYSELQYLDWESQVDEAVAQKVWDYDDHDLADVIAPMVFDAISESGSWDAEYAWRDVEGVYERVRDRAYTQLGEQYLAAERAAEADTYDGDLLTIVSED